jgi:hypothetical protein
VSGIHAAADVWAGGGRLRDQGGRLSAARIVRQALADDIALRDGVRGAVQLVVQSTSMDLGLGEGAGKGAGEGELGRVSWVWGTSSRGQLECGQGRANWVRTRASPAESTKFEPRKTRVRDKCQRSSMVVADTNSRSAGKCMKAYSEEHRLGG